MNILVNALDALDEMMERSEHRSDRKTNPHLLPVSTSTAPYITISTSVIDNQWVQVAIADNGCGIPKSVQERIFDPFFTTKPVGKGTGMGMSISHQIITEQHHGTLECISIAGQGTQFVIQIPIKRQKAAQ